LLLLTGVDFVALIVAAFIVGGDTPDIDASPAKIVDFYKDKEGRQFGGAALLAVGTVFFFFFLGILRSALRSAGDAAERLATVAFGGGLVSAAGILSFAGFTFALADTADKATPEAIQALHILNSDFFFVLAGGQAALLIATGIAGVRFRALPAWLAWIAIVLGVASVTPAGFFAFLGFLVWTLIVSVMLWRAPAAAQGNAANA
jgi:hypothetical protein